MVGSDVNGGVGGIDDWFALTIINVVSYNATILLESV